MKKLIILSVLFFIVGCATAITSMVRLQDRELLISPDNIGLDFPHTVRECTSRRGAMRIFGKKCKMVEKNIFYDFTKESVRNDLRNAGFTCKSKMRFKY